MTFLEILSEQYVQLGIFILILVGLLLNFCIKMELIKQGIYKKVYKQRRIDWEKFKGGVWVIGIAGLFLARHFYSWNFWITFLAFFIFVGLTQVFSGLFLSNRSWKSRKYWD
ncbi:hypothetical protein HYG86_06450 [Alkalicella caledoniensis]|uniref:DUF3784 domain-containing protein n=1 Tax=Alkalicella caledoniensis TaxID=2731377 RepID=A0A7G9W6X5_ALKCA|nr:hypothetical protein [Alkalicella caledoniensis]QNO14437.1 hypothetical protein HYG86_06450 [Alkalicella caledoniensis]